MGNIPCVIKNGKEGIVAYHFSDVTSAAVSELVEFEQSTVNEAQELQKIESFYGLHQSIGMVIVVLGVFSIVIVMNVLKSIYRTKRSERRIFKNPMDISSKSDIELLHERSECTLI